MGSEITVRGPAQILEASRALQAANRRRLETRQQDGWAERAATRTVARGLAFAESRISKAAGRVDPWRGAVPEFETPQIQRARRQPLPKLSLGWIALKSYNFTEINGWGTVDPGGEDPQRGELEIYSGDGTASITTQSYALTFAESNVYQRPWPYPWQQGDEAGQGNFFASNPTALQQLFTADREDPDEEYGRSLLFCAFPIPVGPDVMIVVVCRGDLRLWYLPIQNLYAECYLVGRSTVRKIPTPYKVAYWANTALNENAILQVLGNPNNVFTGDPLTWGWWDKIPSRNLSRGLGSTGLASSAWQRVYEIVSIGTSSTVLYVSPTGTPSAADVILGQGIRPHRQWLQLQASETPGILQGRLYGQLDPLTLEPPELSGGIPVSGATVPAQAPFAIPVPPSRPPDQRPGEVPTPPYRPPWETSRYYSPLVAWDWSEPTYLRSRLLALGWTPADLTP